LQAFVKIAVKKQNKKLIHQKQSINIYRPKQNPPLSKITLKQIDKKPYPKTTILGYGFYLIIR